MTMDYSSYCLLSLLTRQGPFSVNRDITNSVDNIVIVQIRIIEYSHRTVSGAFMGSLRLSKNQKKVLMA
jgi:hypothetical protein